MKKLLVLWYLKSDDKVWNYFRMNIDENIEEVLLKNVTLCLKKPVIAEDINCEYFEIDAFKPCYLHLKTKYTK